MTAIGILGAGLSGVMMGIELRRAGIDDFVIYEKQPDVGGTWYRNTYPGLHCDVPSHLYCYSFEPNPDWSMTYSGQAEIQAYIRRCAEKYGVIGNIRFDTDVAEARYESDAGGWRLRLADDTRARHRVLVSATGGLAEPRFPRIDKRESFEGEQWHAGSWRHDVDLSGKRVAVVGSAASAVQVVPAVADRAKEVFVFSRSPNWVMPRNNKEYSDSEKQALRSQDARKSLQREQYRSTLFTYRAFKKHQTAIDGLRRIGLRHMSKAIDDPMLIDLLTPDFDPGCKRILVSDDYYPALARDHVHLIPLGVTALTNDAVVAADGSETPVDVVIFCTGYGAGDRAGGRAAVDVYGRNGQHFLAAMAERPEAFGGMAVPGFPNYFMICGLNGVAAYASLFSSAEIATGYILQWIQRLLYDDIHSVEVKRDVTTDFNERIQTELQTMSWAGNCTNFYKDKSGRILSFYPGTLGQMRREFRHIDDATFNVEAHPQRS